MDAHTLILGLVVMLSRVADVTLGTMRTISIVHGRTTTAFLLGFMEVSIWLGVISAVLPNVVEKPVLGFFYAFGFSLGNVLGIKIERYLAFGCTILRVISCRLGETMAETIRASGYGVTVFRGEGLSGPVVELYIVCRRKDLKEILKIVHFVEPAAFYLTEQAGDVSKVYRPFMPAATGWRAVFKKK
jgi:uncharacterized protein YebE (UPF0316 family)